MKCSAIRMDDGSVVLAALKPGAKLTDADRKALAEWVQFCRDRRAEEQRKANAKNAGVKP